MRHHKLKKYLIAGVLLSVSIFLLVHLTKIHIAPLLGSSYLVDTAQDIDDGNSQITCVSPTPNSTNAIAILASNSDFMDLASRLKQLDIRLLDDCSSTVLIFHTGFPFASEITRIRNSTFRHVKFQNVEKYFASYPDDFDPYTNEPTFWKRGKWNYHQMIRFWFKLIFEIEEIQRFKYVMRLDSDSRIIGRWFNVFKYMKAKKLVYLANEQHIELEKILPGTMNLQSFFIEYKKKMQLTTQDQAKEDIAFTEIGIRTYYNNFEIFQTKFFRQKRVRAWIDAIDASHGIYKYRWGDAMLRYLTLVLFARDDQVGHRKYLNLSYCHPC